MTSGRPSGSHRAWWPLVLATIVVVSCSGDDATTTGQAAATDPASTDESAPPDGPAGTSTTVAPGPEVLDGTTDVRCERFGYPCSWTEAAPGAWERSLELLDATVDVLSSSSGSATDALTAAAAMLADQADVVEIHPQFATGTAIVFRVEGAPEVIALTEVTGVVGDQAAGIAIGEGVAAALIEERILPPAAETTENVTDGTVAPSGFAGTSRSTPRPAAIDPTHGPLRTPRTALVVDPHQANNPAQWVEGTAIAAIFRANDFSVQHLRSGVTYQSLAGLSQYDAVHINTHGETWCPTGADGNRQFDGERCWSGFQLGAIDPDDENLPHGVTVSLNRYSETGEYHYWVYDRFISEQLGATEDLSETVVMLSVCQGAGLAEGPVVSGGQEVPDAFQTPMMEQFGAVLAWDQVVTAEGATAASTAFWTLMAGEGVDAKLAYSVLGTADLTTDGGTDEVVAFLRDLLGKFPRASLRFDGSDKRIRDIIETRQRNRKIADDSDIEVEGVLGDSNHERIPTIDFLVEGIEEGTEGSIEIQVYIDGDKLSEVIQLEGNATRIGGGPGYAHWLVSVEDLSIDRDLSPGDVDPVDPTDFRWEVRVSDDGFRTWSAQEADPVHFVIDVEAKGPLPVFTQLADALPPNTELTGNELRLRFNSGGGPVEGDFEAIINEDTVGGAVGFWSAALQGSYDADSGTMSGTAAVVAYGNVFGFGAGEVDMEGTWEATVDWNARKVTGVLSAGNGSQPIDARF